MPNQIPEPIIDEVKKANDIVDIIGEYVQLKKQGRNYFGLCPFHGENTPSFSVTRDKQIFHCFGCGKGGNVVTFLMEMENYSFYDALSILAEKSGITLPKTSRQQHEEVSEETKQILIAHEWLTKLYHHLLRFTKDGKNGLHYLQGRRVNDDTIDTFGLGFAPKAGEFTATFLEKKGFQKQSLVKMGLLSQHANNQVHDRFSGRVIFPIRNHLGKTVAFGGRAIDDQKPKYLNSPESALFQKARLFYNFDLAKKHIRTRSEAILLEGYLDVISLYQSGIKNVIATMGTALSVTQAKLLRRYVDTVVICYDSDNAGIEATFKAANLLRQSGCKVKIAQMDDGMDPDDYLGTYGADDFQSKVIQRSQTYISFYMRYLKRHFNVAVEDDKIQYVEAVLKEVAMIESPVEREYYLKELHQEYHLSMDTLNQEINKLRQNVTANRDTLKKKRYTNTGKRIYQTKRLLPAYHNAERQLLAYMLKSSSVALRIQENIGGMFNIDEHKIIATHLYAYYEEGANADVSSFLNWITDESLRKLIVEIALIPTVDDISDKEIQDYIRIIQAEYQDIPNIKRLKKEQQIAEQQNEPIKAAEIAMQIIKLKRQMKDVNELK